MYYYTHMNGKFKFVVWKRNDGYIGASAGRLPSRYVGADGHVSIFELLLETDSWSEAYDKIVEERSKR